ncbi:hypothetical protein ETB97_012029 [Aspergillus alliaceus]|uniref:Uncharacterized protein n=1 Tax=Petromyces alliaceus TaxID=209559 RepID=A0A8H6ECR4_PETAA|nr:hypothetical protein ETB97_012029 [Aspergillus burnettii]
MPSGLKVVRLFNKHQDRKKKAQKPKQEEPGEQPYTVTEVDSVNGLLANWPGTKYSYAVVRAPTPRTENPAKFYEECFLEIAENRIGLCATDELIGEGHELYGDKCAFFACVAADKRKPTYDDLYMTLLKHIFESKPQVDEALGDAFAHFQACFTGVIRLGESIVSREAIEEAKRYVEIYRDALRTRGLSEPAGLEETENSADV